MPWGIWKPALLDRAGRVVGTSMLQVMQNQAKGRLDQTKREADAKITALQGQLKQASDRQKAKIEKRIAEVKADLEVRHAKLGQAGRLAKEALAV